VGQKKKPPAVSSHQPAQSTGCLNPRSGIRNPKWVFRRFESVASTNDVAARLADEGAPEGTIVVAEEQTAGRGRHGRSWSSPAGHGLYLSLVLRPSVPFERIGELAFVASLAAAEAIGQVSGLPAQIKWPNDVLLRGRKVCGILIEAGKATGRHSDGATPRAVIVGTGINVNTQTFPAEISETATSIALQAGRAIPLETVEQALLSRLEARYTEYLAAGFAPILAAWKSLDCTVGGEITVNTTDGAVKGRAAEVSSRGDLIVEHQDGTQTPVAAGEVILRDT